MILIEEKIEFHYKRSISTNTIFDKKIKLTRFYPFVISTLLCLCIAVTFSYYKDVNEYLIITYPLLWLGFLMWFFHAYMNKYAKRKLRKISGDSVIVDTNFFSHWANKSYHEFRLSEFYQKLCEEGILSPKNHELNEKVLREYSDYFSTKAKNTTLSNYLKYLGGIFFLFIIPLWSSTTNAVYNFKKEKVYEAFQLNLELLGVITMALISIIYLRYLILQIEELRNMKYRRISKELLNIKWNCQLNEVMK